jgi:hypothetical protein
LGDSNLAKDQFLRDRLEKDPQIELTLFLEFNRIKKLLTYVDQSTNEVKLLEKANQIKML